MVLVALVAVFSSTGKNNSNTIKSARSTYKPPILHTSFGKEHTSQGCREGAEAPTGHQEAPAPAVPEAPGARPQAEARRAGKGGGVTRGGGRGAGGAAGARAESLHAEVRAGLHEGPPGGAWGWRPEPAGRGSWPGRAGGRGLRFRARAVCLPPPQSGRAVGAQEPGRRSRGSGLGFLAAQNPVETPGRLGEYHQVAADPHISWVLRGAVTLSSACARTLPKPPVRTLS